METAKLVVDNSKIVINKDWLKARLIKAFLQLDKDNLNSCYYTSGEDTLRVDGRLNVNQLVDLIVGE